MAERHDIPMNCEGCDAPLWDWAYQCRKCHGWYCGSCIDADKLCYYCSEDQGWEATSET